MDEDLKMCLVGLEQRLEEKFSDVRAQFADVRAEIEASETRLLSEFWK